jgi:hypothetical protein
MKILLTGCTAQQASKEISNKLPTFSSTLQEILLLNHEVDLLSPSQDLIEEVESYDAVVVGLAPLTSLSANKIYPAFALANRAKDVGNLILSVDAPEPHKIQASINSYKSGKVDLLKNFYSRRKNYYHLVNDKNFQKEFFRFVDFLSDEEWPSILYPSLPWQGSSVVSSAFPNVDRSNLHGIHVDSYLMKSSAFESDEKSDTPYWVCDAPDTKWAKTTQGTLSYSTLPMRTRSDTSESIEERLSSAMAALVSVYRSEDPWWSPLISSALNVSVPVVTEWRYSSMLGDSWSLLGSDIELLGEGDRLSLAVDQRKTYINSLTDVTTTYSQIETIIKETAR